MKMHSIVVGGGCFWCLDAAFRMVEGVSKVVSGYAGGHEENPTYELVSTGTTGHAEVVHITFDSDVASLDALLDIFFTIHDPTTLTDKALTSARSIDHAFTMKMMPS